MLQLHELSSILVYLFSRSCAYEKYEWTDRRTWRFLCTPNTRFLGGYNNFQAAVVKVQNVDLIVAVQCTKVRI